MRVEWTKIGIDYNDLLARLGGSEMLALKFLKQFLSDETFTNIQTNFRQQDYASLARNVHALKGLTGNLSMKKLFELTNIWMDDLRVQNYASTEEMYRCCEREYQTIREGLQQAFQEQGDIK